MKLLLINYEYPPVGGGAGNATFHIAKEMAKRGLEIFVLTSHFKGLKRYEEKDGVKIIRIPVIRRKIYQSNPLEMVTFILSGIFKSFTIKKLNPSISIAFFSIPSGPIAYFLKKFFSIPYIVYLRGGDVPGFLSEQLWVYHKITLPFQKIILKNADGILCVSENLRELIRKHFGEMEIKVIPNGIDLETFKPEFKSTEEPIKFLFVGRLTIQKGLPYLMDAVKELKKLNKKFKVILVGDGPLKTEIQEMVKIRGLEEYVEFKGWINREELPALYRKSDVFVLPSIEEGNPNVLLEALASGMPCIVTSLKGCVEFVKDGVNGFIVEQKNPLQLADAMKKFLEEPDKILKMGKEARNSVENSGWGRRAEEIIEFLSERGLIE
jgi:glycosyltransferase involved in cell wall biosynthesis